MPCRIEYSPEAEDHLRALTARQRAIILTRLMSSVSSTGRRNTAAQADATQSDSPHELRIGTLRVYYDVEEEPELVVNIRAVGIKIRSQVRIGKEIVDL